MIHGIDTGFLVALEHSAHAGNAAARQLVAQMTHAGDQLALTPQVLAEFIHVVTDARRFIAPLTMPQAIQVGQQWWTAQEVIQVFPDAASIGHFIAWMSKFSLGRKRVLDTMLAATFFQAGIQSILTTNPTDFAVFGVFTCVTP